MTIETINTADIFAADISMHHATRAKATKLDEMLRAEYPALSLHAVATNDSLTGFRVVYAIGAENEQEIYEGAKVPSLALLLDTCAEEDIDPSAVEEDEEPTFSGSVVPEKYRALYREVSSTGRSNGDWLAERLAEDTLGADGNLNIDDFIAVLERNDVPLTGKWAAMRFGGNRGWQGRFRMNGRQVLEKLVTKAAIYIDATGQRIVPSQEWLADMQAKHAKWLAKEAKAEAAATEAIKSTVAA
jgi:hypothetical protein